MRSLGPLRSLAVAILTGLVVLGLFALWLRWPIHLSIIAGAIVFGLTARGDSVPMSVGDRLDLPAGTEHDAKVGPMGVECLEAHAPAGALTDRPRLRTAGTW